MSIFVEIAKKFLSQKIVLARSDSEDADHSTTNSLLSTLGFARDTELSVDKRERLNVLLVAIESFNTLEKDEKAREQLMSLLISCRTEIGELARLKGYPGGSTEDALLKVTGLLQSIYVRFTGMGFVDIPKDDEALNIFQYYAGLYCAEKITSTEYQSSIEQLTSSPLLTTTQIRALEREELIKVAMSRCKIILSRINKSIDDYPLAVIESVIATIDQLKREDIALCARVSSAQTAATSILGMFGIVQPDTELLRNHLNAAIEDIQRLPAFVNSHSPT